jgi:hypothetical protein
LALERIAILLLFGSCSDAVRPRRGGKERDGGNRRLQFASRIEVRSRNRRLVIPSSESSLRLFSSSYNNVFKPTMSIQEVRMRDDADLWRSTVYDADS